jgi:hypothetical protein
MMMLLLLLVTLERQACPRLLPWLQVHGLVPFLAVEVWLVQLIWRMEEGLNAPPSAAVPLLFLRPF